jgi:hypothetical protein
VDDVAIRFSSWTDIEATPTSQQKTCSKRLRIFLFCVFLYSVAIFESLFPRLVGGSMLQTVMANVGFVLRLTFLYFVAEVSCLMDSAGRRNSPRSFPCYVALLGVFAAVNVVAVLPWGTFGADATFVRTLLGVCTYVLLPFLVGLWIVAGWRVVIAVHPRLHGRFCIALPT